MKENPLVSIVIPTYKRREGLKRLLDSIFKSDFFNDRELEVIVVVDADGENYGDLLTAFPNVKFIFNKTEKLLSESRNIGIRHSKGKYIFLVDDDNLVDKRCISELVNFMERHPDVGMAGPMMYYLRDSRRIWCAGIKRSYWTSLTKFIGRGEVDSGQFSTPTPSESFPNAFMIRREVIDKIGFFDSGNFPIHYDEADFGNRLRRVGYKIMCNPKAKVWHDMPLPEEVRDKSRLFHVHNQFRAYHAGKNRIIFHRRYSKKSEFLFFIVIFNWLFTFYYLTVIIFGSNKPFKDRLKIAEAYLNGVIEGIKGVG